MIVLYRAALGALALLSSPSAFAQDALPPEIEVRDMGAGRLFVNREGLTLYTFKQDREQPGTSVCVEECAELWPPVTVKNKTESVGNWSVIQRQDGSMQWAYNESPVYTYAKDSYPGAIVGEKASRFWDVLYMPIETPPDIVIQASVLGQILADLNGRTIYSKSAEACDDSCMKPWRPVEAPWLARPVNEGWSIFQRSDGLKQWAYNNQPLYTFTGDYRAGDVNGEDSEGLWDVVVLQDAPEIPTWITFQETDIGPVMANRDRMTLYYLVNNPEQIRRETCDDQCVKDNWDPAIAPPKTEPIGNWSTTDLGDGSRQWIYLGLPVYTFRHDRMPGDTNGDKFGTGSDLRGGWNAISKETLIQQFSS